MDPITLKEAETLISQLESPTVCTNDLRVKAVQGIIKGRVIRVSIMFSYKMVVFTDLASKAHCEKKLLD